MTDNAPAVYVVLLIEIGTEKTEVIDYSTSRDRAVRFVDDLMGEILLWGAPGQMFDREANSFYLPNGKLVRYEVREYAPLPWESVPQ